MSRLFIRLPLVCDDARQFKLVADELALCWIHDGRHYQSMTPCVPQHREWLEAFRKRYWDFYKELLVYRQDPAPERAAQLREEFDELFSTVTGYDELDQRIVRTKADKTYLLMVLEHPEVPLHNNPAELELVRPGPGRHRKTPPVQLIPTPLALQWVVVSPTTT